MRFREKLTVFGFEDGLDSSLVSTAKTVQLDEDRNNIQKVNKTSKKSFIGCKALALPLIKVYLLPDYSLVCFLHAERVSAPKIDKPETMAERMEGVYLAAATLEAIMG